MRCSANAASEQTSGGQLNAPRTLTPEQLEARRERNREAKQRAREQRALRARPRPTVGPMSREPLVVDGVEFSPPRTRGDCLPGGSNGERPCPWVRCRHHVCIDVSPHGEVTLLADPSEAERTCSLDAEHDALTLEQVGALFAVTRERIRQIEAKALRTVAKRGEKFEWSLDDE
jgi:hypothetical protein